METSTYTLSRSSAARAASMAFAANNPAAKSLTGTFWTCPSGGSSSTRPVIARAPESAM